MKEIFRNSDSVWVGLYQSILEDADIPTFVYNLNALQLPVAGLAVAFFPLPLFFPTLCVVDDGDYEDAMQILHSVQETGLMQAEQWTCKVCGEAIPDNFTRCWKCEAARSQTDSSSL
jgi:Putative prokaryotic signal transducing protein